MLARTGLKIALARVSNADFDIAVTVCCRDFSLTLSTHPMPRLRGCFAV